MHCGKETGGGDLYCPECLAISGARKPRWFLLFSILFSGLLLSLVGLLIWHGGIGNWSFSLGSLWGKPAAIINGEAISRDEFRTRMDRIQAAVERQYGKNIFTGERGLALLEDLEERALDGMLNEKLLAQEARKLKIEIHDRQIEEEVQKISREIFGSWEKFKARLGEDGIAEKELKTDIRNILLYNAVKAAKTPAGADPQISLNAWLIKEKQNAE
ncbi:MAG: SurA N-terminal domain-containing protein, partial [Deltaproteobacteria bacterium]|nr:SurA N-terminal domain-containing protein [Deltaproteobacteria bacterium]